MRGRRSAVTDKELLAAVSRYKKYKVVARKLGIGYQTVKNRMSQIQKSHAKKQLDKGRSEELASSILEKRSGARYVVTSAQNATPVHVGFLNALRRYCERQKAQLIVIPYRYQNPTSIWSENAIDDDWWGEEVVKDLLEHRVTLPNTNLTIMADYKIRPTASRPLSGTDALSSHSAIFGHPKIELTTVATPSDRLPKILTTTGAITEANYVEAKAGKVAEHFHTIGACVVEVDEAGRTHIRQIMAEEDGSFIDLDTRYSSLHVEPAGRAKALVTGDTHAIHADPNVTRATYQGDSSIVSVLKPEYLVWHDLLDFYSRNHHHRGDFFVNLAKHQSGYHNVEAELDKTFAYMDEHSPEYCKNIVVRSNHDEALDRWLKEADFKEDPENAKFYLETMLAMVTGMQVKHGAPVSLDPLEFWAEKKLSCFDRTHFLSRDESFEIAGTNVDYHGDKGVNGARGTRNSLRKIGTEVIVAHSHSPGIVETVIQVGLSAMYDLGYNKGPSSWFHCHAAIYSNGKKSLIFIIDDKWRL